MSSVLSTIITIIAYIVGVGIYVLLFVAFIWAMIDKAKEAKEIKRQKAAGTYVKDSWRYEK